MKKYVNYQMHFTDNDKFVVSLQGDEFYINVFLFYQLLI
jgi:hypothetical protein